MEAAARDVQAKGQAATLGAAKGAVERAFSAFEAWQTAGSNALTREGYVQAKEGFKAFEAWQTARQRQAGMPGKADGQAWWKLPRRAMCRQRAGCNAGTREGCAGKGQAAMLER